LTSFFRREPDEAPTPAPTPAPDLNRTTPLPELAASTVDTIRSVAAVVAPQRLRIGLGQHVGRVRTHNEDVLLMFTGELAGLESMPHFGLFVVADGMGGHALGERASGIAARTVARLVLEALLPSLLAALGTLILVYDLGRRLWNRRTGLLGAWLVLFAVSFTFQAKRAQIDPSVTFFIALAVYGFLRHLLRGPDWRWWAIGGLAVRGRGGRGDLNTVRAGCDGVARPERPSRWTLPITALRVTPPNCLAI